MSLNYFDDEGDQVVLMTDDDLKDAVAAARASGKRIVRLTFPKQTEKAARATRTKPDANTGAIQYAAAAAAVAVASVAFAFARKN